MMRGKNFHIVIAISLLTAVALMYVNQQAVIYQMGLKLKQNNQIYSKLVDRNKILVYNVLNLKSPVNLETKLLSKKVELNMPYTWQVVKRSSSSKKYISSNVDTKKGLFANLFSVGREAEASPNVNF